MPTRAITVATPVAVLSLVLSRFQKRNIRFEGVTTKATFNSDKQRVCAANKQSQGQKHKANHFFCSIQDKECRDIFWHTQQIPDLNCQDISN